MNDPVMYDSHMHTPLCHHAQGWPDDYAEVAVERNLRGITFTCHNPMPDGYAAGVRMAPSAFTTYVELILGARARWREQLDIRLGLESDYVPGFEGWVEDLHGTVPLSYILGSVHPQLREYRLRYFTGEAEAFQRLYFRHLAEAAETGLFHAISHPDLVKNLFPEEWSPERVRDTVAASLDRIAETGVAMELNTSGALKAIPEMNPAEWMLREMRARGIPVVLGSDAHRPARVADRFPEALEILKRCGYTEVAVFLDGEPRPLEIDTVLASLRMPTP